MMIAPSLGIALLVYASYALIAPALTVSPRFEPWLSPLIGLVTGVVTGITGVFVMPAVPYLQALNLDKDELVQALGLSFTISTIALAGGLFMQATSIRPPFASLATQSVRHPPRPNHALKPTCAPHPATLESCSIAGCGTQAA